MLAAIIWGLVQGLTEFLPISSSGHLVIVPAFLEEFGMDISQPSLAVSAALHLGTLVAVLIYFRADLAKALHFRTDTEGRKIVILVAIGTVPALVGFPLKDTVEGIQENVTTVGVALIATGVILVLGQMLAKGARRLIDGRIPDAVAVGIAQAFALIPGISRSGITISTGNARGFDPSEAARFSFLLGIPVIAGAGLLSISDLFEENVIWSEILVGMVVAAISGYAAIALLLSAIKKVGLMPFAVYCFLVGGLTVAFL